MGRLNAAEQRVDDVGAPGLVSVGDPYVHATSLLTGVARTQIMASRERLRFAVHLILTRAQPAPEGRAPSCDASVTRTHDGV